MWFCVESHFAYAHQTLVSIAQKTWIGLGFLAEIYLLICLPTIDAALTLCTSLNGCLLGRRWLDSSRDAY